MRLLIGDKFLENLITLPQGIQKKVIEFQKKFRDNRQAPSINFESIASFQDQSLRTARIDLKYRAIIGTVKGRDDYYLLWVDNHDEAMNWAMNKSFEWNEATNSPQLYTIETSVKEEEPKEKYDQWQTKVPDVEEKSLIESLDRDTLISLGVPPRLIDRVSGIRTLNDLEILEGNLPVDVFERLFYLMDEVPLEEVLEEIKEASDVKEGKDSLSFRRFYVEVDDELLQQMLDGSLEKWSIFLHPSQQLLVNSDFNGPVKVTGGAGTGKTVAALHRLKYLTDRLKDGKVLFATYTKALKKNLDNQSKKLRIDRNRFEIDNIDNAAMNLAKGFGLISDDVSIVGFQQTINCRDIWEKVLESEVSSFESDFLEREVQQIILHHDITDEHAYMRQTRIGMGMPVSRRQRIEIWDLYEKYRDYKRQNNLVDRLELFNTVASHINQNHGLRPYRHVILDEVQDCSNVEIRFLRSLVDEGVNDMFLVGDPYQSIYQRRVVFSQAGVNIRGRRSRKLKVNYRTTEEIKRFAVAALQGIKYNDFDESEEELKGYVSIFHGQIPEYRIFDSENDELDFILEQINELVDRGAISGFSDVVVAARTRNAYRRYIGMLHRRNIPYYDLREESGSPDGLHLCTFHSLKGLEYKVVFLADINERTCPNIPKRYQGWNEEEKEIYLNSERSLLYTAMTRAIKGLWITGVGKKTQWIGKSN